jgi:anti-sigma regulatory factor (Ser/Thr protein kinase)
MNPAIPKENREEFNAIRKRVLQGEMLLDIETQQCRRNGSRIDVSISTAPLYDASDNVYGLLSIVVDITEHKRAEEQKREFYQKTILAATKGKLVITDRSEIEHICGPAIAESEIKAVGDPGDIRAETARLAREAGMDESRISDFVLCIGEATTNAYKHVGSGSTSLHRQADTLIFVVSDLGPGIEAINLPEVALKRSYTTAVSLGMGYKAMISLADRIYLSTGPTGTTVAIEMHLHKPEKASDLAELPDTWATG